MKTSNSIRRNLGAAANAMRRHFGLTVEQLATALGWPVGTVRALLAGTMRPSEGQIADLARWSAACRLSKQVEDERRLTQD